MPDLKSELKKLEALKFDDEGTTQPEVITQEAPAHEGVSETMFRVIKDNPGCNRARIMTLAENAGVARSSSSSLLGQFVKRGLLRTEESPAGLIYFAVAQAYKPGYVKQKKRTTKPLHTADATIKPVAAIQKQDASVQDLLDSMSITTARALYDELRKIFWGST